jgi:O-antigen/teichoic acid export membrane protein
MLAKLRALSSDTLIYGVSTVLGRFLTFLLTPLYTNYVSPAELGDTAYLYSLIAFVNVLYSCGFDSAFFKFFRTETDTNNDNTTGETEAHNRTLFAHAFGAIGCIAGTITLVVMLFAPQAASFLRLSVGEVGGLIITYAALIALFDALTLIPYAALRMERRAKRFAMTKFGIIAVNVLANIVLVIWLQMGVRGIFLAGLFSAFAGVIVLVPDFARYLLRGRVGFDATLLRELWRFGLPTVPAAFSAIMLQVVDRPILKLFVDSAAVGVYQANYRLGIPMMMMVTVFEYAWKPFYLRETSSLGKKTIPERRATHTLLARVLTYFTVVCGGLFLVAGLLMEFVVRIPFVGGRFVNPAYWSGLGIIPIVLGAYYFNGMFANFAASAYIRKRTQYLPRITGAAALVNIALNFALIPYYGIWGAAWATLGAYMVSAVGMYWLTRRIYPLRYEWKRVGMTVLCVLMLFFGAKWTTLELGLGASFLVRCAWITAYPLVLVALGVFGIEENVMLRRTARPSVNAASTS